MIYLTDKLAVTADSECYMVGKPRQRAGKGVSVDNPRYLPGPSRARRCFYHTAPEGGGQ